MRSDRRHTGGRTEETVNRGPVVAVLWRQKKMFPEGEVFIQYCKDYILCMQVGTEASLIKFREK